MSDSVRTPPPGFDSLSVDEQIDYVQSLWDRIAADPQRVPVPEWHLQELRRRESEEGTEPPSSSWDDVRARLLKRDDTDG